MIRSWLWLHCYKNSIS